MEAPRIDKDKPSDEAIKSLASLLHHVVYQRSKYTLGVNPPHDATVIRLTNWMLCRARFSHLDVSIFAEHMLHLSQRLAELAESQTR
jgi:hypothetical protein